MSFPTIAGITFGEVNETSSHDRGNPEGLLGQTPDGALFRWMKSGSVALSPFLLVQSAAVNSSNDAALDIVGGTSTGGVTVQVITQKALTVDEYKNGFLTIDTAPGEGRYRIAGNQSGASGATVTITLDESSPLKEALSSGTTKVGLWHNLYKDVIVCPTTVTGLPLGVPQVSVASATWFWGQSGGLGMVETDNAPAVNTPLVPSASSAGSLESMSLTSANDSVSQVDQITVAIGISAGAGADKANLVKFVLDR